MAPPHLRDTALLDQPPEIAPMSDPDRRDQPPGLEAFLGRHEDDVTPRERRQLATIRFRLEPGAKPDDRFCSGILEAIRAAFGGPAGGGGGG